VRQTRLIVRELALPLHAEVIEREENLGLARSIVGGVTELCERFGRVIVLEDDLVVNPIFVDYMLQGLGRYQHNDTVYQISGFMFPVPNTSGNEAFFMPLATTWGWATWARAWRCFSWEAAYGAVEQLKDRSLRRLFDLDDSYPYTEMLEGRLKGQNDSWGILWWWAVFAANGNVLYPPQSLVVNTGFDGSGTHCSFLNENRAASSHLVTRHHPMAFPDKVEPHQHSLQAIKAYLRYSSGFGKQSVLRRIHQRVPKIFT
jgi:hypothetical protein